MKNRGLSKIWLLILIGMLVLAPRAVMAQMPWPCTDYPAVVKSVKEIVQELTIIKGKVESTVFNNQLITSIGQGASTMSRLKRDMAEKVNDAAKIGGGVQ